MARRVFILASLIFILAVGFGCSSTPSGDTTEASATAPFGAAKELTLPAGTVLTVRLGNAVGSKISATGDSFSATLAKPVELNGTTVVPAGAEVSGRVMEAVSQGRFKGAAVLKLALTSITVNGDEREVTTSSVTRTIKGKGKRTATLIGGGAGAGALIGGLAGGGKGALIGAAAGAGAGTAGAAYTGNKEIILPAESTLSFKLAAPLSLQM